MNIKLGDIRLPLDPHPTFLGITLDPKLKFDSHLKTIVSKLAKRINLFKKIKGLKINDIKINSILFKSTVRSVFDYDFIPLSCPTQRISSQLQIIQNRILKQIKYFPPGTSIKEIHKFFNLQHLETKTSYLLKKFHSAKTNYDLISPELEKFKEETNPLRRKLTTVFNKLITQY